MKMKLLLLTFWVLNSLTVFSQTKNEVPYIEVTAIAEKVVIPDMIYIKITIKERMEGKQKIDIESQENKFKNGLTGIKIPISQLQLLDANSDYIKIKRNTKDVIAQKNYMLLVKDANEVSVVFKLLDELNIYEADISKTEHSKMTTIRKEARIEAMKVAKEKATYMLNAIDEQIGKPIVVNEVKNTFASMSAEPAYQAISNYRGNSNVTSENTSILPDIQIQKIYVSIEVYIKFEIKQK